ncbi:MAG: pyrimidine 5'-nucleotidase [Beijerinckiaceae bacterium]
MKQAEASTRHGPELGPTPTAPLIVEARDERPVAVSLAVIAERFAHVDTWVFDLDNTLYPSSSDLWPKIDARITLFMCQLFGLDGMSSRALQKYYYERYGTTLRGLMAEHEITADEFLAFVHDIDRSSLKPNHSLATAITALPGRKLILTNGSREHALRTAEQLGLDKMFEDVFDIVASDLVPKPDPQAYERFFEKHGVDPAGAAMFEDIERNLVVPHARGMRTTLVVPKPGERDHRDPWEVAKEQPLHVDYVTDDLEGFLVEIVRDAAAVMNQSNT